MQIKIVKLKQNDWRNIKTQRDDYPIIVFKTNIFELSMIKNPKTLFEIDDKLSVFLIFSVISNTFCFLNVEFLWVYLINVLIVLFIICKIHWNIGHINRSVNRKSWLFTQISKLLNWFAVSFSQASLIDLELSHA